MFIDEVKVYAKGGNGGNGCVSFRREKFIPKGGPDGGHGGRGGDVILEVDPEVNNLIDLYYKQHWVARNGGHGLGKQMTGKNAPDLIIKVPPGTLVYRDEDRQRPIADLLKAGERFTLCRGGRGGRGNMSFKSSTHQVPREYEEGKPGEDGHFFMELKIAAHVGLVGYPNAGKSTLISRLTNARPKIAAYPFTTLNPIIGTLEFEDYRRVTVADIPGLIKGASENVGLGHAFLRHIERCQLLVIVIDMSGMDGREPWEDYRNLLKELKLYEADLLERPRILVANKLDLEPARENLKVFKRKIRARPVVEISALNSTGIDELEKAIHQALPKEASVS